MNKRLKDAFIPILFVILTILALFLFSIRRSCSSSSSSTDDSSKSIYVPIVKDVVVKDVVVKEKYYESNNTSLIILQTYDQFFVSMKSWNNLGSEIPELSQYFSAFYLPPLSKSSDKVGYIPTELLNFNSDWGTEEELTSVLSKMKDFNILPLTTVVTQHREASPQWFAYKDPTFLQNEDVSPNDYYKYIDTLIYYPWGNADADAPPNFYKDGLPPGYNPNIKDDAERLRNCYVKDDKDTWSLYKDCRNQRPMYGVTKQSNPSWIQSVNLCNIDVLKAYFIYMKKIQRMGIRGIRIDQADAVSHQFISLFLNSDVSKTPFLLQAVLNLCNDAKSPQVNKDVNYPLEQNIQNANMEDFTNYDFDIQSMENFTYELRASAEKEKGWRGQLDMLDNVNDPLNKNDWAGCIDYPLKYILNDMFNTADNSIDGSYFVKDKMLIGYEKYKNITLTIVDNHDTIYFNTLFQGISPITKGAPGQEINFYRIIAAYFVIMMLPGIPTINKVHYDIYKTIGLQTLMQLRNDCCIDSNSNFEITTAESNNISWKVSKLNFSIIGRLPPIIPKPTIDTVAVLLEINEKQPLSSNVWNQLIFGTKLYMKISYL